MENLAVMAAAVQGSLGWQAAHETILFFSFFFFSYEFAFSIYVF